MAAPIVFISRNRLASGGRRAFEEMYGRTVDLIHSTKPGTALFAAYLDAAGSDLRIVHAFRDAAAMADHFEGSEERASAARELFAPTGFEVYGTPPSEAVEQLRRHGDRAGAELELFPGAIGGYLRPGSSGW